MSLESRAKVGVARKGKALSLEHRRNLSLAQLERNARSPVHFNKGRKHSIETRAKVSAALIGNKNRLGIPHTVEVRLLLSRMLIGNKHGLGYKWSAEAIRKRSEANQGYRHSLATRIKQSDALAARRNDGSAYQSKLEQAAACLLHPYGFSHQSVQIGAHRFDYAREADRFAVEINGCYFHDHRAATGYCTLRRTCGSFANDERIRNLAREHGYRLIELWGCEKSKWPKVLRCKLG